MVDQRVAEWRGKFGNLQGGKEIVSLTGETSADLRLLEKGDVIVCTPAQVCLIFCMAYKILIYVRFSGMCFLADGNSARTFKILDC